MIFFSIPKIFFFHFESLFSTFSLRKTEKTWPRKPKTGPSKFRLDEFPARPDRTGLARLLKGLLNRCSMSAPICRRPCIYRRPSVGGHATAPLSYIRYPPTRKIPNTGAGLAGKKKKSIFRFFQEKPGPAQLLGPVPAAGCRAGPEQNKKTKIENV